MSFDHAEKARAWEVPLELSDAPPNLPTKQADSSSAGTNGKPSAPPALAGLVKKLADACDAVGGVEKKGRNEKQNYKYLKAADVAKAIRHELFSRGIIITFDEKEFTQIRTIKTNSGGEMGEFMLRAEVTFRDELETLGPFGAIGVAMDTGDKAIWKAKTGALKYVLRGIGLIPDEKDDPEADEKVDKALDHAYQQEFDQRTETQRTLSEYQIRAWNAAVDGGKACRTAAQIAAHFKKLGIPAIGDMTRADFNESIKWLLNPDKKDDFTQDLKQSVSAAKKPDFSKIFALAKQKGVPEDDVRRYCYETFKVKSMTEMVPGQLHETMKWLELLA